MSDWGQGAKNNNIGWGQGAVNNDISWGASHKISWAGDTEIVGTDGNVPVNTVAPVISGTALVGNTLTSTTGTWTSDTGVTGYLYQWTRDGVNISGATNSTYTLVSADLNTSIICKVAATDTDGTSAYVSSNSINLPLLLDTYTNAAAAYSLRKLRTGYTGSAIRVRRASDNTETNIGFVNNELDTATLASFCSGTNGFVTTWYDQSGNNRNATQANASLQPLIVTSGVLFIENNKPAIKPVAGQNLASTFTLNGTYSIFQVDKRGSITANYYISNRGGDNSRYYWYNVYNSNLTALGSSSGTPSYYVNGNLFSGTTQGQAWTFDTGLQRILSAINLNLSNWNKYEFQYGIGDNTFISFQERILYSLNQTTNRANIETEINNYYNIY